MSAVIGQHRRVNAHRSHGDSYYFFDLLASDALLAKVEELLPEHRESPRFDRRLIFLRGLAKNRRPGYSKEVRQRAARLVLTRTDSRNIEIKSGTAVSCLSNRGYHLFFGWSLNQCGC